MEGEKGLNVPEWHAGRPTHRQAPAGREGGREEGDMSWLFRMEGTILPPLPRLPPSLPRT